MSNQDAYYSRSEVSNSDLTALKQLLHPGLAASFDPVARERAFRMGSLVDALITEPGRVNEYRLTVDDERYDEDEFRRAREMRRSLQLEAKRDAFLSRVLDSFDTQAVMVKPSQLFTYGEFNFSLPTRCKWDWWSEKYHMGGDLKTTGAATQSEFEAAIDAFDWDRSRAWYMDIANSDRDFIYAISKRNYCIFKKFISRDDAVYTAGRNKYEELAFQYWCLSL